jgi:hypothetical protein
MAEKVKVWFDRRGRFLSLDYSRIRAIERRSLQSEAMLAIDWGNSIISKPGKSDFCLRPVLLRRLR